MLTPIPGLMPDPSNLPEGCKFFPRCPHAQPRCSKLPPKMSEVAPGHYVKCVLCETVVDGGQE